MKVAIALLLGILILLGAGSLCTVGTISNSACIDCGMTRDRIEVPWRTTERVERTIRTDWYDRRIGAAHEHHRVRAACTTGQNMGQARTHFIYSESEPLASDFGTQARVLLSLEPLNLDVEFHPHLAHADRRHRIAAAQAAKAIALGGHSSSLLAGWPKASEYLADPSLWNQSCQEWAYPNTGRIRVLEADCEQATRGVEIASRVRLHQSSTFAPVF